MSTKRIEHRSFKVELRAAADKPVIEGYAAVYNAPTDLGGGYTESVHPDAFKRSLAEKHDVKALFNHDPNKVLGRTKSGTLRLSSDNTGLHFETDVNESDPQAMSVRAMIMRGDVDQCSFSFRCQQDQMTYNDDGTMHRELQDVDLIDVSPVTNPAYEQTSCEARSAEEAVKDAIALREARKIESNLSADQLATLRLRVKVSFRDADGDNDGGMNEKLMGSFF